MKKQFFILIIALTLLTVLGTSVYLYFKYGFPSNLVKAKYSKVIEIETPSENEYDVGYRIEDHKVFIGINDSNDNLVAMDKLIGTYKPDFSILEFGNNISTKDKIYFEIGIIALGCEAESCDDFDYISDAIPLTGIWVHDLRTDKLTHLVKFQAKENYSIFQTENFSIPRHMNGIYFETTYSTYFDVYKNYREKYLINPQDDSVNLINREVY